LAFLAVRNVDATKRLAEANGAKGLLDPHTIASMAPLDLTKHIGMKEDLSESLCCLGLKMRAMVA
jgi:hypothetical protein